MPQLADILGISVEELMQIPKSGNNKESFHKTVDIVLKGIALAMGISVAVLSVFDELVMTDGLTMLGIGLGCAAASMLSKV